MLKLLINEPLQEHSLTSFTKNNEKHYKINEQKAY